MYSREFCGRNSRKRKLLCHYRGSGYLNFTKTANFAVKGIPSDFVLKNPTTSSFDWTVRVSEYFDSSNYIRAGICNQPFTNGQSAQPAGIVDFANAPANNVGAAVEGTVTGQSPGTTYTLYGFVQAANGLYYHVGSGSKTITTELTIPSHPVYISSRIEGGFNLYWGSSPGALFYILSYKYSYVTNWSAYIGSGTTYQLTGREYGVQHDFRVRAVNANGTSDFTEITYGTTAPKTPAITNGGVGVDSITINVSGMEGNWDYVTVNRHAQDGTYIDSKNVPYGSSSATWSGLTAGVVYKFNARSRLYVSSEELFSVSFSNELFLAAGNRPQNFAWTYPKVSGQEFNLTATEWNAFTSRINVFRAYKGLGSYGFTTAYSGSNFTAAMFNQARNAIAAMNTTGLPGVRSAGEVLYASYLNNLVSCLNAIS